MERPGEEEEKKTETQHGSDVVEKLQGHFEMKRNDCLNSLSHGREYAEIVMDWRERDFWGRSDLWVVERGLPFNDGRAWYVFLSGVSQWWTHTK